MECSYCFEYRSHTQWTGDGGCSGESHCWRPHRCIVLRHKNRHSVCFARRVCEDVTGGPSIPDPNHRGQRQRPRAEWTTPHRSSRCPDPRIQIPGTRRGGPDSELGLTVIPRYTRTQKCCSRRTSGNRTRCARRTRSYDKYQITTIPEPPFAFVIPPPPVLGDPFVPGAAYLPLNNHTWNAT